MVRRAVLFLVLAVMTVSVLATASPATLGSAFANAYTAFAPLYTLYRGYAEYLFSGTALSIPRGLDTACQSFSTRLSDLQVMFITQTASKQAGQVTLVAHLRASLAAFCTKYEGTIGTIAALQTPSLSVFSQASDDGFFAAISGVNKALENVFTTTLDALGQGPQAWRFAAAFVTQTLLNERPIQRIDPSLKTILLGTADAPYPPGDLPTAILPQVDALVGLVGHALSPAESSKAAGLASQIHAYLLSED
jgi:hypothetical protein